MESTAIEEVITMENTATEEAFTISVFFQRLLESDGLGYVLVRMAIILLLTFVVARLYQKFSRKTNLQNKIHLKFIHNIVVMLIYVAGVLLALNQFDSFDKALTTLLAGSGIAALTIGLAAQESLGNAINGMFISFFRHFEVGDRIHLIGGNITGNIEDITLRHTVVRTFVNSRVIIPNSVINKDMIENSNFSENKASGFIDVTITYESDLELAKQIMLAAVIEHPDFVDTRTPEQKGDPIATVFVRALTVYGVDLRISMWTKNIGSNFGACSDVRQTIKSEFDRRGIQFAHSSNPGLAMTPPQ